MKPVNLAAQLATAETELACVRMVLAHVKVDRDELRQERDEWPREAEMLCAEKLMSGAPLPWTAAHGGDASREARSERLALCA